MSNWCAVEGVRGVLGEEEREVVFERLVEFAGSEREKIASHGVRGLGSYVGGMYAGEEVQTGLSEEKLEQLKQCLLRTISHKSPKVSWNALVSFRHLLRTPTLNSYFFPPHPSPSNPFLSVLLSNFSISNFKLQLQTIETLKSLPPSLIRTHISTIIPQLLLLLIEINKQELNEYSFNEYKNIRNLSKDVVQYIVKEFQGVTEEEEFKEIVLQIGGSLYVLLENIYGYLEGIKSQGGEEKH